MSVLTCMKPEIIHGDPVMFELFHVVLLLFSYIYVNWAMTLTLYSAQHVDNCYIAQSHK